jgi:hypothetical protein
MCCHWEHKIKSRWNSRVKRRDRHHASLKNRVLRFSGSEIFIGKTADMIESRNMIRESWTHQSSQEWETIKMASFNLFESSVSILNRIFLHIIRNRDPLLQFDSVNNG